jgi:uncharacterized protein YbjT (DUF2867 family)
MEIAVIGGSGLLGTRLVEELSARGHDVRSLTRRSSRYKVDLDTGAGLEESIAGCDVVINAVNNSTKNAAAVLAGGTRRLAEIARRTSLKHHICVSIVGSAEVPLGYFRAKREQELEAERGGCPWTILRSTQFDELLVQTFSRLGAVGVMPLPEAKVQPVAVLEVARTIANLAEGPPHNGYVTMAGPQVRTIRECGRHWIVQEHQRGIILPIPLPGKLGKALRSGALTCPSPDILGQSRFAG